MAKPDHIHRAQMIGQNQYLDYEKCWVQTKTLAKKDPNYISMVLYNIEADFLRIYAITWSVHLFEDDRQLVLDDSF